MDAIDIFFNIDVLRRSIPILLRGLGNTLMLGAVAILFGTALGVGISLVRLYAPRPFALLAVLYTDLMRALPVLVVLLALLLLALGLLVLVLHSRVAAAAVAAAAAHACR